MWPLMLSAASALYGAVAAGRRAWYTRRPGRRRHLRRPVISIGSLRVGGSGKTPVVGHLAEALVRAGERPAILSRGYKRAIEVDGVTVVSDGQRVLADVRVSGDEPFMLAQAHPGVPVLVASSRYLAGRLAEERLGATLHLLDDGFQHVELWRDIDLLLVSPEDLDDHVLPQGRLREPLVAGRVADAVLVPAADDEAEVERVRAALEVTRLFRVRRTLGDVTLQTTGADLPPSADLRVLTFAGIARPERFFQEVTARGWTVVATRAFPDHHRFTSADMARLAERVRSSGANLAMTTAKDAVRLATSRVGDAPLAVGTLRTSIEPAFFDWLLERLQSVRERDHDAGAVPNGGPEGRREQGEPRPGGVHPS